MLCRKMNRQKMLPTKMRRDLWENKGAYLACLTIIVVGLVMFTTYSQVLDNLVRAQESFYQEQNFAEGFIELEGMPFRKVEALGKIKGIKLIQGRVVRDVRVLLPERNENIYLRMVSLDTSQERILNDARLIEGSAIGNRDTDIWVDNQFFTANNLELNGEIQVVTGGRKHTLQVVGTGRSPEFVYALRTAGEIFPTPQTFGIAFMPLEAAEKLFGTGGSINNIVFTLEQGVLYEQVEEELKQELNKYGIKSIFPREEQLSHLLLSEEIKGISAISKSMPAIFLGIAAMILYITLKRLTERQRGQIGILKAFGYRRWEIMRHYLSYAFLIGGVGGLLGSVAGTALSYPVTTVLQMFFNMPGLKGTVSCTNILLGTAASLLFSLFAGYRGTRSVLALEPVDAMRPVAPLLGRKVFLERIASLWGLLTVQGRMAVRNISRHPGRTVFIFLGIMFTFSLLSLPWTLKIMTDRMVFEQYEKIQTYDLKIPLAFPLKQKEIERELGRYPGVQVIESLLEAPVTLRNDWRQKDVILLGITENSQLFHILDESGRKIPPPKAGILLSERLASLLDTEAGEKIIFKSKLAENPEREIELAVTGVIPQVMGINAYMGLSQAQNILGQGAIATSMLLNMEEKQALSLREDYRYVSTIDGIEDRTQMLKQAQELMGAFNAVIVLMILLGSVTGFAIIYNASLVTLSERSRDLATMLVLGMTPREVLSVVTFEQWFIGFWGMLAGLPLTKLLLVALAQSYNNDIYTIPSTTNSFSFLIALVFTVVSIRLAQQIAARRISSFDLAAVFKDQE